MEAKQYWRFVSVEEVEACWSLLVRSWFCGPYWPSHNRKFKFEWIATVNGDRAPLIYSYMFENVQSPAIQDSQARRVT